MIKINYKGFAVEFESIQDTVKFMEEATKPVRAKKELLDTSNIIPKRKKVKKFGRWTVDELQQVSSLLKNGGNKHVVSSHPTLLDRHSPEAIEQLVGMFTGKSKSDNSSPLVREAVRMYQTV